tara:strand:+ start:131 stop:694 length:564 start_codon:yes stop_codon:yes gene_type:complete
MNIIQIGANRGNDDLSLIIGKTQPTKLILVEPFKLHNTSLLDYYSWVENISIENLAIGKETGKTLNFYYHIDDGPGYEISSLIKEHITKPNHYSSDDGVRSFMVETININDLFEKYNLVDIDILFIDAEGYDYKIISGINFEKYNIKKLYFENLHLESQDIYINLESKGYKIDKHVGLNGWSSLAYK